VTPMAGDAADAAVQILTDHQPRGSGCTCGWPGAPNQPHAAHAVHMLAMGGIEMRWR
jgi:hypothetical protein